MIKFFRKISQRLISENKFSKYLIYAIGETILVVIGILIALSINNWNQVSQLKKVEKSTIEALVIEFKSNKTSIQLCLAEVKERRMYGDSVRMQLGPGQPMLTINKMNKWFGKIGATNTCAISIDILIDVQSSGNLNIISNEEIRRNISKWSSILKELENEEKDWAREFSSEFIPYTNKWISWDDVDNFENADHRYFNTRFQLDPRLMLQQLEFSNIMAIHYWRINRIEGRITNLLKLTEYLLELMQRELK